MFDDPLAVLFGDEAHSDSEFRELLIGRSLAGRLLLVGFTERPEGVLRLIGAREVTRKERQDYENHLSP